MVTRTLTMMTRTMTMMTRTHLAHKPRQGRSRGHHAFPAVEEEKADEDCVRADFHTRHCFLFSHTVGKVKEMRLVPLCNLPDTRLSKISDY